jgi:hypothetical protein
LNDYQSGPNLLEVEEKMLSLQKEMALVGVCRVLPVWAETLVDNLLACGKVPDVPIMEEEVAAEVMAAAVAERRTMVTAGSAGAVQQAMVAAVTAQPQMTAVAAAQLTMASAAVVVWQRTVVMAERSERMFQLEYR